MGDDGDGPAPFAPVLPHHAGLLAGLRGDGPLRLLDQLLAVGDHGHALALGPEPPDFLSEGNGFARAGGSRYQNAIDFGQVLVEFVEDLFLVIPQLLRASRRRALRPGRFRRRRVRHFGRDVGAIQQPPPRPGVRLVSTVESQEVV